MTVIHTITWVDLKGIILKEKKNPKASILYDSSSIAVLKWQNYRDGKHISGSVSQGFPEKQNLWDTYRYIYKRFIIEIGSHIYGAQEVLLSASYKL